MAEKVCEIPTNFYVRPKKDEGLKETNIFLVYDNGSGVDTRVAKVKRIPICTSSRKMNYSGIIEIDPEFVSKLEGVNRDFAKEKVAELKKIVKRRLRMSSLEEKKIGESKLHLYEIKRGKWTVQYSLKYHGGEEEEFVAYVYANKCLGGRVQVDIAEGFKNELSEIEKFLEVELCAYGVTYM